MITILALGSRGDVVPYLALGRGLRAAGHRVRVATYENFGALVAEHGLEFHRVGGDIQGLLASTEGKVLMGSGQNVLRQMQAIRRTFGRLSDDYSAALSDPILRDSDVLLCQLPGAVFGYDLAEALGIPLLMVAVTPLARTRAFPMVGFPAWSGRLPGFSRISYTIAEQLVWQVFRPAVNRFRNGLGLGPQRLGGYFRQLDARRVPVLKGISPAVFARPADWPAHIHLTGYWLQRDEAGQPPEALCRFLEAGPPPVFIGFGSTPVRDPRPVTAVLLEALRLSGQRGLLHRGWAGLGADDGALPAGVFALDYAPFEWLFPRTAAVVHHGGSGTTATGMRAGVPSVLVPFVFDQFFWAGRVADLGVGPRPVPFRHLTAEKLAAAITTAVTDSTMQARAAALGQTLAAEDGIGQAVGLIEQYTSSGLAPAE